MQFPDPDLAKAVFAAQADTVSDPVKGALGWFVVKVTKIVAGGETTFDQAKDAIKDRVIAGKAADILYDRANKLDQLLGNGSTLDDLPGDLGLVGVAGTMDADGNTQEGNPAPIPGQAALREAIIKAAFDAQLNDQPRLTEVQTPSNGASAYYALVVESIIPPGMKPFDTVKDAVLADWQDDQKRRAENVAATAMMTAVQGGQSFSDAATVAGVTPRLSPLLTRSASDPSVPAALLQVMFGLKPHEATMVETAGRLHRRAACRDREARSRRRQSRLRAGQDSRRPVDRRRCRHGFRPGAARTGEPTDQPAQFRQRCPTTLKHGRFKLTRSCFSLSV